LAGKTGKKLARLIDVADLSLKPFKDASDDIANALHSPNPWERYWGLIVCSSFGKEASAFFDKARALAESDEENLVRVRAAEFLGLTKAETPVPVLTECLQKAQTSAEANLILNTIVLMRDTNPDYKFSLQKEMVNPQFLRGKDSVVKERLIYLGVDIKVD
jgi:HEAT repeat protein